MIAIIDNNLGNLGSMSNMLRKIGAPAVVTSDAAEIERASKLILPGVGAFDTGMRNLSQRGLLEVLRYKALVEQVPILGVCLGMQLMAKHSEEGREAGLGWVDADVVRFQNAGDPQFKIPNMGWNSVRPAKEHHLIGDLGEESRFYFVHSYFLRCANADDVLLTAEYGCEFVAGFQHRNVMGVQFHPEKSHKYGMRLLANFAGRC